MRMTFLSTCFGAMCLSNIAFAAATITIIPTEPVRNEPVYVRVQASGGLNHATFKQAMSYVLSLPGGGLRVLAMSGPIAVPPEGSPVDFTFYVGRLPLGDYTIDVSSSENPDVAGEGQVSFEVGLPAGTFSPQGNIRAPNPDDYSGLWYDPDEPGTSLVLQQGSDSLTIGGGVYLYGESGEPTWFLLAPLDWTDDERTGYRLDVVKTRGSDFEESYDPNDTATEKVGEAMLTFIDRAHLQFVYSIGSFSRTVVLSRYEL